MVKFSCPADVNVTKKILEKEDNYGPLICILQVTYSEYRFSFITVIVGAMGAIPIDLNFNIKKLRFDENKVQNDENDSTEEHHRKCTVLHLKGKEEMIVSDIIYFSKRIFHGDSLSILLFILSVNPLSFLLHKLQGYACGKHKNCNVMHNFFVDDLKLYASSINTAKKQLDLVRAFSKDTGMTFVDDICAYQQIQNGTLLQCTKNLEINQLSIKPMKEEDTYKYLSIDENISYIGPINKHRITREYYR